MGEPTPPNDASINPKRLDINLPPGRLPPIDTWREWQFIKEAVATPVASTEGRAVDPEAEKKKTDLSIILALDAYRGDTHQFPKLRPDQQADLVSQTQRILNNPQRLETFLYALATHDIGKHLDVRAAVEAGADVDHDEVFRMLVCDSTNIAARLRFMPNFDLLPADEQQIFIESAKIRSNYPQTLQAEAPASTLGDIHNATADVRDFKILEAKFDIFGAAGHINQDISLTATESGYRRQGNLDRALRDPSHTSPQERRNAFFEAEIRDLTGSFNPQNDTERARLYDLAHLECRLRIETPTDFAKLAESFDRQPSVVQAVLASELNRPESARATLAEYSPNFVRTIADKYGLDFALTYFAHVLQEIHIADKEARSAGSSGILPAFMGDLTRSLRTGEFDPRQKTMRFAPQDGALVAVAREANLVDIGDLPEFTQSESLRNKRILLVGIGGGSDGIQASMLGKLMTNKYGCQVAAVTSVRNEERVVTNTGQAIGRATKEITRDTQAVGDWRFLEKIPLEDETHPPMYILNSTNPEIIKSDIKALQEATGAEVIISVDTGGDSLYKTLHPGFSAHLPTEITPDQDYIVIQSLAELAREQGIKVLSSVVAPGVDSPDYAREVLDEIEAERLPLTSDDAALIQKTYAQRRMDGSGNEEGRYGKTPLAWLHALKGNTGFQILDLPKANVTSNINPWRAFTTITPAMAGIVLTDISRHYAAIRR